MDNVPIRTNGPRMREQNTTSHTVSPEPKPKRRMSKAKLIVIGLVSAVLLALAAFWALSMYRSSTAMTIDSSKYQAIFFTNGQVYFGKLQMLNGEYMKLENIFYLQTKTPEDDSKNPQETSAQTSPDVQLIKLGDEVHGPNDEMIVNKDQILFFENLKDDGKVSQSIKAYQK